MKGFKFRSLLRKAGTALSCAFFSVMLFAQDNLGKEVITNSTAALKDLLDSVVQLLRVVMGFGAIVVLAMVIFKVFKGDREAAEKLAWWVAGLTIGFVLLTVVSGLISGM